MSILAALQGKRVPTRRDKTIAALALSLSLCCILLVITRLPTPLYLSWAGVQTQGTLTSAMAELKSERRVGLYFYSFNVGSVSYSGQQHGLRGLSPEERKRLRVDGAVRVTYLPDQPTVSVLGDPDVSMIAPTLVGTILVFLLLRFLPWKSEIASRR